VTPTPIPSVPLVAGDRPLVLLPVRLETRFFPVATGGSLVKIRVFPDTIHTDTHEPGVTLSEAEWGRHYWRTLWRAANDEERRKSVWRQLAERYEPQRASWVIWHMRPLNPEDRPANPIEPDTPLTPEPRFPEAPQLNIQEEPWTRPPWTRVLPDHWFALAYVSGAVVSIAQGGPISDPLPLGPSPKSDLTIEDDQPPVDEGMKWMVDFEEAVRIGMGLQLVLPPSIASLDRLIVFGVKATLNSDESAGRLADLIAAQSYTQGFSFLPPGTASNNTADAPSGFSSFDPGYDTSFQANQSRGSMDDKSNGGQAAKALGIPADKFARIERSGVNELTGAQHMNAALWQATWGYFLEQMMSDALPPADPDATIRWVRQHFIRNVRAGGPLPAFRCGRQPYGLLPVTSLDLWQSEDRQETALVSVLSRLRPAWMRGSVHVSRVGKSEDPEQDVIGVLRLQPTSGSYSIRAAMGRHYFQNLWQFQFVDLEGAGWWTRLGQLVTASLNTLGFQGLSARLHNIVYAEIEATLKSVLVQPGVILEDTRLTPNFIEWLLQSPVANIRNEAFPGPKPNSLLYALLRHSALLEYTKAAQNILLSEVFMTPAQRRETEIIEVEPGANVFTPWKQLATITPDVSPQPLEIFLHQLTTYQNGNVVQLGEFRSSLGQLSGLAVPELERLLTGTLDLCSYRLDAWITSIATGRLTAMRQANRSGVYLGGYGWVENLSSAAQPPLATIVPEESGSPVFALPDNPGFIHAPSLTHAATAAILRNGHLTHQNVEAGKLLAIDLSSSRVRLAKWLLDGVRAGQPLGALLGYRFERGLHEGHPGVELDRFIAPFREMAPLAARKLDPAQGLPVEAIAANNVVDGLRLQQLWRDALSDEPAFFSKLGSMTDAQRQAVRAELMALDDSVDAVSDALLAESVHQAVQGDASRASATLDAVARGDARPPELDVIETPRSGTALTHRVVALFSGAPPDVPGWTTGRFPFRAEAEQRLNAWAGQLLGNPARVRCRVELLDRATGEVTQTREVRLADLAVSPLDLVYAVESNVQVKRSEIEQRLLLEIVRQAPDFGPYELLRVNLDRDPSWSLSELSGYEFFELLRTVRALITRSRGIDGRDLAATGVDGVSGIDDSDLSQRAAQAKGSLQDALTALKAGMDSSPASLSDTLLRMAHFGIAGAVPAEPAQLLSQAQSVEREAAARLARAQAAPAPSDAIREVFGSSFVVAPVFRPPNAEELAKTWANSVQLQGGNPMEAVLWFGRASRVREGLSRLEDAFRYAEALGTGAELNLRIGQLPLREDDRWVALPLSGEKPLSPGTLSLVAQVSDTFDASAPLSGLLIDEWIETVPNATETTGVAFQYDQPDATPPQSVLIAVPPRVDQPWTADMLQKILLETMDLARMRMVDPSLLGELQHFLPALYFASNAQGDTVSTDWAPLTR
jgi:hypothetical protein